MRTAMILTATLALVGCDTSGKSGGGGSIEYVYGYDEALDKAEADGKNVALYFTANW